MPDIKNKFRKGAIPSEEDFSALIDYTTQVENLHGSALDLTTQQGVGETKIVAHVVEGQGNNITGLDADNIATGILNNGRLPAEIDLTQAETVANSKLKANEIAGNGLALTNLNADELISGTVANERLPNDIDLTQGNTVTDTRVKASQIVGNGALLTELNANALMSGTLSNERLPEEVDLTLGDTVENTKLKAGQFAGDGSAVINLDASELKSGVVSNERLPTEIDLTQGDTVTNTRVKANQIIGNGALLTELNASELASGTVKVERLPAILDLTLQGRVENTQVTAGSFTGTGSDLTRLNANHISDGILDNDYLNKASKSQYGVVKYANQTQLSDGTDNLAVTARALKDAVQHSRDYIDGEVALLKAGVKFKKGVTCVVEYHLNLNNGDNFPLIDGYQIKVGDRVLFVDQDDPTENRVWLASQGKSWQLAEDFDASPKFELFVGLSLEVLQGDKLKHSIWTVIDRQNPDDPKLSWQKRNDINNYQGGEGIIIDGFSVKADPTWLEGVIQDTSIPAENVTGLELAATGQGQFNIAQIPHSASIDNSNDKVPNNKAVKSYVDPVATRVGTLESDLPQIQSQVSQNSSEVSQLDTRVGQVESNVSQLNTSLNSAMPKGAIIMWSGVKAPTGWALCDGQTHNGVGTPDLRNRFVVGAGSSYSVGNTGGANNVRLSTSEMPSHNHSVNDQGHSHTTNNNYVVWDRNGVSNRTGADGSSTYSNGVNRSFTGISINNNGGNQAHENRPPYYALSYIMKVT